jgi:type IV secretion system protein VirB8
MSDIPLDGPDIAPIREALFQSVIQDHKAEQSFARVKSRAAWWIGGIGAAIGVIGMCCGTAAVVYLKPVVQYTTIDTATGAIVESFGAKDAPKHFNERVIERYLTDYIELRERFVWQLDPETFHRVTLMSSPEEQKRYKLERDKQDPAKLYGMNGYARVTHIGPFRKTGNGRDGTLEYDVQFTKSELLSANMTRPKTVHMTARIGFQFHPELPMSEQDRHHNEAGLYVVYYNASAD